jgi:hypothetical protein
MMKKNLLIFTLVLFSSAFIFGQNKKAAVDHSQVKGLTCKTCHSCDIPTKENPCLINCPRDLMVTIYQKPKDAPAEIIINKVKDNKDLYTPVKFTHLAHAEMAEMSGGCISCHHYNPPGDVIPCSNCHEPKRKREDITKPDLKGAYHRLCNDCHRAWSGKNDCNACHTLNAQYAGGKKQPIISKDKKRIHPEIKTPEIIKYETPKTNKGKMVNFAHTQHINTFGLECQSCHKNDACIKCHDQRDKSNAKPATFTQKHKNCLACHDTNNNSKCNMCHTNDAKDVRFNHKARTGFDLSKFHSKLSCVRCHTTKGKFTGLSSKCSSCHGAWDLTNFNHAKTGLKFDETHAEFECESCHKDAVYNKPDCSDCHDDKTYPKDKPGKLVR